MLVIHHLNDSRSQRILWLAEELGAPYEIKHYARDATTRLAPPELKAVNPLGKSPVITDGDRTLAESGAILEYLVEAYGNGRLKPAPGTPERVQYTYFLHYAEGSLMPLLLMKLVFSRMPERLPFLMKPVGVAISAGANKTLLDPQIRSHFMFLESELGQREWFAGPEFTAADIQMSFPLEAAAARAPIVSQMPRLSAFLDRVHARPAYRRALDKGGPYELLK
jgi:glutathione S-transferase